MSKSLGADKVLRFLDWEMTLLDNVLQAMFNQRSNWIMRTLISVNLMIVT